MRSLAYADGLTLLVVSPKKRQMLRDLEKELKTLRYPGHLSSVRESEFRFMYLWRYSSKPCCQAERRPPGGRKASQRPSHLNSELVWGTADRPSGGARPPAQRVVSLGMGKHR